MVENKRKNNNSHVKCFKEFGRETVVGLLNCSEHIDVTFDTSTVALSHSRTFVWLDKLELETLHLTSCSVTMIDDTPRESL